jgi:enterochelin esterase family protein
MNKDKYAGLQSFLIPVMLLITIILIMSCSNSDKKSAEQSKLNYLGKHYGSHFEEFTDRLMSLPEDQREAAVMEYISLYPETPVYEADSIVSLYWYGKANTVVLNGDLQLGWSLPDTLDAIACGGKTFFHRTFTLPKDARIDYLLIIDSVTATDPRNPLVTPSGYGDHSEIAMPGFSPDPLRTYREDIAHGILDSIWLVSRDTSVKSRMAKVYVPAGYDTLSKLPVIYVTDGKEAMEFMQYTTVLDNLLADGKIEPLLVVFMPPAHQHSEYIGDGQPVFMKALCDEFVPIIDRMYKTASLPGKRAIAGISSGGHMALLTVFSRPDVFLMGVGQSPTISFEIYKALSKLAGEDRTLRAFRIWIDAGAFDLVGGVMNDKTFLEASRDLHYEMEKRGITHVFNVYNDGHQWANWRERTDEVLVFLFGKEGK